MTKLPPIPGHCSSCGHYNEIIARFCAQCGSAVSPVASGPGAPAGPMDVELVDDSDDMLPLPAPEPLTPAPSPARPGPMPGTRTTTKTAIVQPTSGGADDEGGASLLRRLADIPAIESDEYEAQGGRYADASAPTPTSTPRQGDVGDAGTKDTAFHMATTVRLENAGTGVVPLADRDTAIIDPGSRTALTRIGSERGPQGPARTGPAEPEIDFADPGPGLELPENVGLEASDLEGPHSTTEVSTGFEARREIRSWLAVIRPNGNVETFGLDDELKLIGKSSSCSLRLGDELVSRFHFVVQVLRDQHYLIDVKSRRGTLLNGEAVIQSQLQHSDVIRVGNTFLLYLSKGLSHDCYLPLRPLNPGRDVPIAASPLQEPPLGEGTQLLFSDRSNLGLSSSGENVLVGSHSACRWRLTGEGIALFHAQVLWKNGEPQLWDLGSGLGCFVNREAVQQAILRNGDTVQIGHYSFAVQLPQSIKAPPSPSARRTPASEKALYVTCIRGPDRGGTQGIVAAENPMTIGSGAEVDLPLHDSIVSERHAAISVEGGRLHVRDLTGRKSTVINGAPSTEGKVVPGQLFKVGHDVFLLHYGLSDVIYRS